MSVNALERHLASHCAASPVLLPSPSTHDEPPATSRSPSLVRSIGDLIPESARRTIFEALERHPKAAKDVRAALDREVA